LPLPLDRESGVSVVDVDRFASPIASLPPCRAIGRVEQPRIAGFSREQNQLANGDNARVVPASSTLNVADFVGKPKTLAVHHTFARSPFDPFPTLPRIVGLAMNSSPNCLATCKTSSITASTASSFIGYLTGLSRPEQVVHFFRQVIGAPVITKDILV
jgi:hypothetical protein